MNHKKLLCELKEILFEELNEMVSSMKSMTKLSKGDIEDIHNLTDTIKITYRIMMLMFENEEYSQMGEWEAHGNSYRGEHYVRGHYSHEKDMSERRMRSSRDDSREHMIKELREMLRETDSERVKSAIHKVINEVEQ